MKARIFVTVAVLCAFLSTAGSRAWAVTSSFSLSGLYACAGTGTTTPEGESGIFIPFTVEGILNFVNSSTGSSVTSPGGSLWVWDIAGFSLIDIAVTNGDYSINQTGQGDIDLFFAQGLPLPLPPGVGFSNQAVLSNVDATGIAHTFVMTFRPPSDISVDINFVQLTVCQAESQQSGNPTPANPPTPK